MGSEKVSQAYQILALPSFSPENTVESEPNDTFPMEIETPMLALSLKGYLKNESDIDRFKILRWKEYYYSVHPDDPDLTLDVEGRAVSARRPFYSCLKSAEDIIEVKFKSRKDRPAIQGHDYHINLAEKNERFEEEPNNTGETAQPHTSLGGDTSASDPDFFVFEVKDGDIEYNFSNQSSQAIDVSISDDEGFDVLPPQTVRRDKVLKLDFDFPKGKYFVKIVGQSKTCSPYQLSNALLL